MHARMACEMEEKGGGTMEGSVLQGTIMEIQTEQTMDIESEIELKS